MVDGFEAIFSFQMDTRAAVQDGAGTVTSTLLYERCMHTGSDGLAFRCVAVALPPHSGRRRLLGYGG